MPDPDSLQLGTYSRYVDDPYPVRESDSAYYPPAAGGLAFSNPLPTIVSVVADAGHNVIATVNAGPTDAGAVITWWELEYKSNNSETTLQIDYNPSNDFSVNRDHTDTFAILPGLDFRDKRIRFVIQAVADASQVWRSLYLRLPLTAAFNNDPPTIVTVPGPPTTTTPPPSVLEVTLKPQNFVLKKKVVPPSRTLQVAVNSRYKLTKSFIDSERDRGVEFDPMSVLDDFYDVHKNARAHRITQGDIGFLDRVAVQYFGPGNEALWWAIAYSNAIVDPEQDMRVGDTLLIPPRETLQTFLARRPVR